MDERMTKDWSEVEREYTRRFRAKLRAVRRGLLSSATFIGAWEIVWP